MELIITNENRNISPVQIKIINGTRTFMMRFCVYSYDILCTNELSYCSQFVGTIECL